MEQTIFLIQSILAGFVVGMSAMFILSQIINHKKFAQ